MLYPDGSYDVRKVGAQEDLWPGVYKDEVFNRNCFELGLRVANAIEVEGMGDASAIVFYADLAVIRALEAST